MKNTSLFLILFIVISIFSSISFAGGPLYTVNGKAVIYKTVPIHYRVDQGPLGAFTADEAKNLAESSFQVWEDVPTATVSFVDDGTLSVDVNGSNFNLYTSASDFVIDGISPIIFDSDGSITDSIFGDGANKEVIGFAGSAYNDSGTDAGYFIEGESVMNGLFTTQTYDPTHNTFTLAEFKSTFVHEFGHFIGLDHTQINGQFASDSASTKYIPTMFPTSTDNDAELATLNPDDIVNISLLYPESGFLAGRGGISGSVTRRNGSIVQGANVLAIDTTDTLMNVYSTVTDYYMAATGDYAFQGLPAGSYWIKIEPIDENFTGGSSVGPYASDLTDLSFVNPVAAEYYNGANESGDPAVDNPAERTAVSVIADSTTASINVIANGSNDNSTFTEDFSYSSGALLTDHGWTAHSGTTNAISVASSGLQFAGYSGSGIGNAASLLATGEDDNKTFTAITSGSVYASFMVNVTSAKSGGDYFFHLSQNPLTTATFLGRVYVKLAKNSNLAFGLAKGSSETPAYSDSIYSLNTTYLVVLKYSFNTTSSTDDAVRLYVINGAIPETEPATAAVGPKTNTSQADANGIGSVALRQGSTTTSPTLLLDGIRINTSWVGTPITDVSTASDKLVPRTTYLSQNYPNPFNPATTISYHLAAAGNVRIQIFDVLGRIAATLVDGVHPAGNYQASFNANHFSTGMYFYRMSVDGRMIETKRMLLLK